MNRNFENRKPTKVYAKSKENKAVIKALNMYGRVPETWELLEEIERLNNIINELENYIRARVDDNNSCSVCSVMTDDLLNILKGSDKE